MKSKSYKIFAAGILLPAIFFAMPCMAQRPVKEYYLTIRHQKITKAGVAFNGVTVNDSIPAPTLYFTEGDSAVIHIKNEIAMDENNMRMKNETSVHWHGILIPNLFDGVPYLTTPPIEEGKTFTVRFPVRQHGTYWYHSHSMFQEQSGLYGAIVIYPKKEMRKYDKEIVLLLADITKENPNHIMTNLKRNTEWYAIKKGQAQSLNRVIAHHGLGERIQMAWQRMPPMDISDVYYNRFVVNGDSALYFPNVHPGERIRLRVIDGSSSTFFHVQYAGGKMKLIAADGQDVQPVQVSRVLMGIAETYDFIITVPQNGMYEFRATAQDGSGYTSVYFGKGILHEAPTLPRPDLFHLMGIMMQGMAGMKMKMNGMNMYMSKKMMQREMPYISKDYIGREDMNMAGSLSMNMGEMNNEEMKGMEGMKEMKMDSSMSDNEKMKEMKMDNMEGMDMSGMNMNENETKGDTVIFNYDMLKALHPTNFDTAHHPVRELTFNLTGSMWRYIWSINGKTLSQKDSIRVEPGEILRIKLVNQTMMYHPMHLHGHFFRVINANGDYSPLKHTLIVPPMRSVTIEFEANEDTGAWIFHCHVLYHMMAGMASVFQYSNYVRDSSLANYPASELFNDDNAWYFWGDAVAASNMAELNLMYSNMKNAFTFNGDAGPWKPDIKNEAELSYERFVTKFLRPYAGIVTSNKYEYLNYFKDHNQSIPSQDVRGVAGVRYLLPFFLNADVRIDTRAHVRFQLDGETWMFPRWWLHYMWNTDKEYSVSLEARFSQHLSLTAGYHSDYKWDGGLKVIF